MDKIKEAFDIIKSAFDNGQISDADYFIALKKYNKLQKEGKIEKSLEVLYEALNKKKLIESELLDVIEQNPKFIYSELMKSESAEGFNNTKFGQIFKPYLDIIRRAITKRKKQFADGIIINNKGEVLMLLRTSNATIEPSKWGLPGGHVDPGENADQAVVREVLEETNFVVESIALRHVKETDKSVISFYNCYVSPDQIAILDSTEHANSKWVNREELQKLDCIFDLKDVLNKIVFPIYEEIPSIQIEKSISSVDAAIVVIKKAFDEGQISPEKFGEMLSKTKLIKKSGLLDNVVLADKLVEINSNEIELEAKENTISPLMQYLKQLVDLNDRDIQKRYFDWQLQSAKCVKLTPIEEIRKLYPNIDAYLKVEFGFMKQCYINAAKMSINNKDVIYVEGLMYINGVPLECAFNKIDDKYFDITKDLADVSLSNNANDTVDDCVSIIELNCEEVLKYAVQSESYSSFLRNKFLSDNKIQKADEPKKVEEIKTVQAEVPKKLDLSKYSDDELELHATRSSVKDLKKVITEGRNPKLREIAMKHLATRTSKEKEHSLYDLMVVEEVEGDHSYSTDENTIHFDKQPDDDILDKLNKHGIKYLVASKEV